MTYNTLYDALDAANRALCNAANDMDRAPCDSTIDAYERALDRCARARAAIKAHNDADMARRDAMASVTRTATA